MLFLIIELDKLTKNYWCSKHLVNRDFIIRAKNYKNAVIKFLLEHPEIKNGEFLVTLLKHAFTLDTNRIKKIRAGIYKFPYIRNIRKYKRIRIIKNYL